MQERFNWSQGHLLFQYPSSRVDRSGRYLHQIFLREVILDLRKNHRVTKSECTCMQPATNDVIYLLFDSIQQLRALQLHILRFWSTFVALASLTLQGVMSQSPRDCTNCGVPEANEQTTGAE